MLDKKKYKNYNPELHSDFKNNFFQKILVILEVFKLKQSDVVLGGFNRGLDILDNLTRLNIT